MHKRVPCVALHPNKDTNIFFSFSLPYPIICPLVCFLVPYSLHAIPSFLLHLIFHAASHLFSISILHLRHLIYISLSLHIFFFPRYFLSVWPRPVHSEHQIRFAGRHHPSPPAAEQRARHPDCLPWKWRLSTWSHLSHPGRPVHLTPPRPTHTADVHPQPQLPRNRRNAANPRAQPHTQPQPPPPGAGGPPSLSNPRRSALTTRHASLWQPPGSQPHHAGRLLQPSQPRLSAWGLCQGTGKA